MTQLLTTRSGGSSSEITTTLEQILLKLDQLETRIQANENSSSSFGIPLLDYGKHELFYATNPYIVPSNGIIIVNVDEHSSSDSTSTNQFVAINGNSVGNGFAMFGFNQYASGWYLPNDTGAAIAVKQGDKIEISKGRAIFIPLQTKISNYPIYDSNGDLIDNDDYENVASTPMYFKALIDNCYVKVPTYGLEVSNDNKNWQEAYTNTPITLNRDQKLYIRAKDTTYVDTLGIGKFITGGAFIVAGNIMSLLYKEFERNISISQLNAFYQLFYDNSSIISAKHLILPPNTFYGCYSTMFEKCTSLTQAPELPATTLARSCYQNMFQNCTSLTSAPELPATTLADDCYYHMFNNCPLFSTVKMKASMSGVYNKSTHGDIGKTVEYVL